MRPSMIVIAALSVALPVAIEAPDSSLRVPGETRVSVAGGAGYYALVDRGCEGQVIRSTSIGFREGSASIEHRFPDEKGGFPPEVTVHLRAGLLEQWASGGSGLEDNRYVNPSASLDWSKAGFGAGAFLSQHELVTGDGGTARIPVSAHLRLGPRERAWLLMRLMEGEPLYASGGYFTVGVGFAPVRRMQGFVGLSAAGPYDAGGLAVGWEYRLPSSTGVNLRARLGSSDNLGENAVSLGISQAFGPEP